MKEALENSICSSGGCPPINGDCYFDRKRLRFENIILKDEVCKSLSKEERNAKICVYSF